MRQRRKTRLAEVTAGLASLILLAALIAGLPAGLYAVAGSPLPHSLPSLHQAAGALARRDTGTLFVATLRDLAWAGWACFTLSAALEIAWQSRGKPAPRVAGIGGIQHLTRSLVASAILAFSAAGPALPAVMVPAAAAAPASAPAAAAAPARLASAITDTARPSASRTVTVVEGDNLWDIAARHLGDAQRWPEIARLNYGRLMPDGAEFTNPAIIVPGFTLLMPPQAAAPHAPAAANGHAAAFSPGPASPVQHPVPPPPAADPAAAAAAPPALAPAASVTVPDEAARPQVAVAPVAGAYALGLASAGMVLVVGRMRHRQRQLRRRGRRIALPASKAARRAEHQLRQTAAGDLPGALRTALACLAGGLAGGGHPLPGIAGLHLSRGALEVLLTEPAPAPPPPYTIKPGTQDMCWLLPAAAWTALAPVGGDGRGDLLPGLITAGVTSEGGYLLPDLEAMGVTTVDGPGDLADQVIASAAFELATNPWAGEFDLLLAGFPELAGTTGRAQACATLDEAVGILTARARQLDAAPPGPPARQRRLADPASPDWTLTLLVSRLRAEPEQMTRLLDTALPGCGIAVLIAGDVTDPAGREAPASLELNATASGGVEACLHPLDLTLTVQVPGSDHHAAIAEIFQAAGAADVASTDPPYDTSGVADWLPAPPVTPGPDPWPSEPAGRAADGTAGPVTPPHNAGDHTPAAEGVRVAILGPVQITGAAADLQPKHAELVLALSLAGETGLSNSALRTMLGPDEDSPKSPDSLRQIITRTRRELGTTPGGGEYIVHLGNSQYALDRAAWLDWDAFGRLAAAGRDMHDRPAMWSALNFVRGRPLDGAYHWWVETALIEAIRAEIVDTADVLAEVELHARNPAGAGRAARAGLGADRAAEQLWRALMRAEDAAGNTAGVHKAWQDCRGAIADIARDGEPHPDTTALYRQLTRRDESRATA